MAAFVSYICFSRLTLVSILFFPFYLNLSFFSSWLSNTHVTSVWFSDIICDKALRHQTEWCFNCECFGKRASCSLVFPAALRTHMRNQSDIKLLVLFSFFFSSPEEKNVAAESKPSRRVAELVGRFRLGLREEVACSAPSRSNDNKPLSWDTLFI